MLISRHRDNGSVSEEEVWLADDFRKAVFFSEAREIRIGLGAGARM
jgi:hypothetical protein